ncbi:hypothetical protein [Sporolactobacillus putidus]|uniref:Uncharacterized protein n=1 Tax=Sporolactobacillus putidus TaxID=492735 RepID=A0A917W2X3_9BACL|nr:hypothetical protein [Sporolactobacillus putidus]GGL55764.1 hypothetical protein GCM10007968_19820 [Sporolactobacillus putidus]
MEKEKIFSIKDYKEKKLSNFIGELIDKEPVVAMECGDGTWIHRFLPMQEVLYCKKEIEENGAVGYTDKEGDTHSIIDVYVACGSRFVSIIHDEKGTD